MSLLATQLEVAASKLDTAASDAYLIRRVKDALMKIERTAKSMRDRAEDNPQGVKAETLKMFAEELELALKP